MELKIQKKRMGNKIAVIEVEGVMDVYTSPKLKEAAMKAIGEGDVYLVIKMRKVSYMDSTGLAILLGALKKSRENKGNISLVSPHRRVMKVLEMIDLRDAFCVCSNIKEALKQIKVRGKR